MDKYAHVVKLNNLSEARRRKKITAKYEILRDLCVNFDEFSECARKENLIKYLGLFSGRDPIPDNYFEDSEDPETVSQ